MKIKSATGTTGFIIDTLGGYMFRVYHNDGEFTDYTLHHGDLEVTIKDEDAVFYPDGKGGGALDYSPETRGIEIK
jgi:hypothetical protein